MVRGVQPALINNGGGGGENYWCDETEGTCSCLGGSLSDDCWLMQQYCTTTLQCSDNPPYKCTCSYLSQLSHGRPIFRPPVSVGFKGFTR